MLRPLRLVAPREDPTKATTRGNSTVRCRAPAIQQRQAVEQDLFDRAGPWAARVIEPQQARPSQQVRDAALMQRFAELPMGAQSSRTSTSSKAGSRVSGSVIEAPTRRNRIDRRVGRGKDPQPEAERADAPVGFID